MEQTQNRRWQVLDGTMLKIIAMISMVFDHVGDNFFPEQTWMRAVGRIALPIFAFCTAEGYLHTRDRKHYLLRMGIFALISEIPFDLVTAGKVLEFSHQNIMATFFWAILGMILFDRITAPKTRGRRFLGGGLLAVFLAASIFLGLDYNMLGIGLVFIFCLLRNKTLWIRNTAAMVYHAALRNMGIYWFGLLGFLPIFCYNGRRGRGLKWLFYIFYPAHLLLIRLIRGF